jgi:hypothetical protein
MKKSLILFIALMMIGAMVIGGCGGSQEDGPSGALNPEQVVLQFINALKNLELEEAKSYLSSGYSEEFSSDFEELVLAIEEEGPEADAMREMFNAIFANSDFTVTGYTIDGDTAIVNMDSTIPDMDQLGEMLMGKLFEVMFSGEIDFENMTEDEEMMLFVEIFTEVIGEVEKTAATAEVPMVKEEDLWKIDGSVVDDVMGEFDF